MLAAPREESKPVAHPCRGPGGQAGDYQKRKGPPTLWYLKNVDGPQCHANPPRKNQGFLALSSRIIAREGHVVKSGIHS